MLGFGVNPWEVLLEYGMEVVIGILVKEGRVDHHADANEAVIE